MKNKTKLSKISIQKTTLKNLDKSKQLAGKICGYTEAICQSVGCPTYTSCELKSCYESICLCIAAKAN